MLKRYVYEVFADSQEEAERAIRKETNGKYYLLTTEPVTDPIKWIKGAKENIKEQYEVAKQKDYPEKFIAYLRGYEDAIDTLMKNMEGISHETIS